MARKLCSASMIVILLFFSLNLFSSSTLEAPRAESPPLIDGKLDDAVWAGALKLSEFKTFQPDYGKEPSQKTEGYMLYDAENFYFAFRGYDSDPNQIKASICKRDAMFADDYVGILIDTFNNNLEAYAFCINPLGIQGDGMINHVGNLDPSHDMVWYSKSQMDEQGFTVEVRIPLQSIRFPGKKTFIMGLLFFRQIVRHSEMASVPSISLEKGAIMAQAQPVSVTGLRYKRVMELLPAFTYSDRFSHSDGDFARDERRSDISLTGKIGLTSELTMDGAYNPDFSQVEADAGQVDFNIRYALYFAEKRPFFQEGNEFFQFAGATEESFLVSVVHTRTIIDPIFGLKLTGKLGTKNTIAAIYARDDLPGDEVDEHPDFTILRFKHSFKDDSYIGGFYTGRDAGSGFNRVVGSDGRFRLTQTSVAEFHLFGSFTRGNDSDSTLEGHALSLKYEYTTRKVNLVAGYHDVAKDFQVDTGFLTRTGVRSLHLFSMYSFYPKSKFFQRIEPFYWSYHTYDKYSGLFETINLFTLRFQLPRSTQFRIDGLLGNEVYEGRRFLRNGIGAQFYTQMTKKVYLSAFYRLSDLIFYDPDDPYQGHGNRVQLAAEYQPVEKLDFIFSVTYSDFYRKSDREKVYDYTIYRNWNTFQINKYLFLRAIFEYNTFHDRLTVDTLVSFTYIPGTVVHLGYGSAFQKLEWIGGEYVESDRFLETQRGFFFKVSYLWRF
ncbi:MAG: DUF5916 domain-containing protein [Candidatus Aminicenantales bacterium]